MATHSIDVLRPRRPPAWNPAEGPPAAPQQRLPRPPLVRADGSTSRDSGALWAPSQGPCRPETGGAGGEPSGRNIPIRKDCWD